MNQKNGMNIGTTLGPNNRVLPFSLPLDAVTQTGVIYGGKGMGKTTLASVLAEEFQANRQRFCYLDPMGVAWGLQHGIDKTAVGLDVLILGGIHGDIPIEPSAGAVVADLVAEEAVSTVVDISRRPDGRMWSKAERIRFVADFVQRLYERQGEKRNPLALIIDEAARFIPQMIPHGSPDLSRCAGAIEQATEEGRNVGLGMWFVTQRSARMNKSVSELAECMVSFRIIGPNSMEAVLDWLGSHVEKTKFNDYQIQLRQLPRGQALVISPGWLKHEGVVSIRQRHTFDSSATPKPGQKRQRPGVAKKVDIHKYSERMRETIDRAKSEDPRTLRHEIQRLKGELVAAEKKPREKETVIRQIPILNNQQIRRLETLASHLGKDLMRFERAVTSPMRKLEKSATDSCEHATKLLETVNTCLDAVKFLGKSAPAVLPQPKAVTTPQRLDGAASQTHENGARPPVSPRPVSAVENDGTNLRSGAVRILQELATRMPAGYSRAQVGGLTGFAHNGGTFKTYMSDLKRAGYIEERGDMVFATEPGVQSLGGNVPAAPTSHRDAMSMWRKALRSGAYQMLEQVVAADKAGISRNNLAAAVGMEAGGGTFKTYISDMRRNGLVTENDGVLIANDILFPER